MRETLSSAEYSCMDTVYSQHGCHQVNTVSAGKGWTRNLVNGKRYKYARVPLWLRPSPHLDGVAEIDEHVRHAVDAADDVHARGCHLQGSPFAL